MTQGTPAYPSKNNAIPYTSTQKELDSLISLRKNLSVYMAKRNELNEQYATAKKARDEDNRFANDLKTESCPKPYLKTPLDDVDLVDYMPTIAWITFAICAVASMVLAFGFSVSVFDEVWRFFTAQEISIVDFVGSREFGLIIGGLITSLACTLAACLVIFLGFYVIALSIGIIGGLSRLIFFLFRTPFRLKEAKEFREYAEENQLIMDTMKREIDSLDQAFNSLSFVITKNDYEYVDYLIYLYQTHRADDLRDALFLLDSERRTNRIVEAVTSMKSQLIQSISNLCQHIDSSMDALNRSISSAEARISENLSSISKLQELQTHQNYKTQELLRRGNGIASSCYGELRQMNEYGVVVL